MAISYEILGGNWYPRWLSLANFGKGDPFLNFYSPGFYLTAGYLSALGIPILVAIKAICIALFALGAWGMYLWLSVHYGVFGALLSAVLYLFAPYHFVDVYVRGAMAEFSALAFLPFLFYGMDLSFRPDQRWKGITITGVATAAIILLHNLSALMITPFAVVYFIREAYVANLIKSELLKISTGPLLGMGLAAFYWLPVLLERGVLNNFESKMTSGDYDIAKHFITPQDWFSSSWGFGSSGVGQANHLSYQIGMALLLFFVAALVKNCLFAARDRGFVILLALLGSSALFLTIDLSTPFYKIFTLYRHVQFPWRFLGPASLFMAATAGALACPRIIGRYPARLIILIVATVIFCIFSSTGQRSVVWRFTEDYIANEIVKKSDNIGAMTVANDYLPRWVDNEKIINLVLPNEPFAPTARIEGLRVGASRMTFTASSDQELSLITFPWFYFPGFRVRVDDEVQDLKPDQYGFMAFALPFGSHRVELFFGTTPARVTGWGISIVTLMALFVYRRHIIST